MGTLSCLWTLCGASELNRTLSSAAMYVVGTRLYMRVYVRAPARVKHVQSSHGVPYSGAPLLVRLTFRETSLVSFETLNQKRAVRYAYP